MILFEAIDSTLLALDTFKIVLIHDYILFYMFHMRNRIVEINFKKKKKKINSFVYRLHIHHIQIDRQMKKNSNNEKKHTQVHAMYEVQMEGK